MVTVNRRLLPIKAHFFFFFAAIGPILPQLNVFGKQLGVSAYVMGFITAGLPILWALAKPTIGFLVDFFHNHRKLIFMLLIFTMSGSYFCLYFLPDPPNNTYVLAENMTVFKNFTPLNSNFNASVTIKKIITCDDKENIECVHNRMLLGLCGLICLDDFTRSPLKIQDKSKTSKWQFWFLPEDYETPDRLSLIHYDKDVPPCDFFNMNDTVNQNAPENRTEERQCNFRDGCIYFACAFLKTDLENRNVSIPAVDDPQTYIPSRSLYTTVTFWGFVIFMSTGTVAFNVANCIGDAICFDVLGNDQAMKYGFQRAFGTFGYGLTAIISGYLVDYVSGENVQKDFTPAFFILAVLTIFDMYFCRQLKLPSMSRAGAAGNTLSKLLREKAIVVFLIFSVVAGIFDSFIIYYMFWFLEELATETKSSSNIKFLEGLIIAVESFGGEIIFFMISGKILKRFGFRNTLSLSLLFYSIRLLSISLITKTWHLVIVEMFLQGPTYALCYATIVGYAAAVAPPGLSATLQGIMAGMDDGVGFAIGSFLGGILYDVTGGRYAFKIFSALALFAAITHAVLNVTLLKDVPQENNNAATKNDVQDPEEVGNLMTVFRITSTDENVESEKKPADSDNDL